MPPRQSELFNSDPSNLLELPAQKPTGPQPASLKGKTVYVVDAHSLIFQVFHALPEMTSPGGQPVGAVYGFTRDMLFLLEAKQPDYLICAFDLPGETFRHGLYDAYKIQRTEMPEELRPQIPNIRRVLASLAIPALDLENYEADDVLATVAHRVEELGGRCLVVTGDKDCRQLITEAVQVYNVRKNEIFDAAALEKEWGILPSQVVDFQALVGDAVDNVPGVPMIGPKIAGELIRQYGTLDAVLEHAGEIKQQKRRENLINFADQARMSRELTRLVRDLPLNIDWNAAHVGGIRHGELAELFHEFGFRSLAERFAALDVHSAPEIWEANYRSITTREELEQLTAALAQQKRISLDTETTGLAAREAEIVGYSFAWQPGEAVYVPVRAPEGEPQIDPAVAADILRGVLENPNIEKLGQNLKYDRIVLRGAGIELAGTAFDTMVASYLLDAGSRTHNMDELAKRYLNHTTVKISELIGSGRNQKRMDEVPLEQIAHYAAEDADVPLRLAVLLEERLKNEGLLELFSTLEMPLIDVLVELEYNGIRIDENRLAELSAEFGRRMEAVETEIYALAGGEPFNIASPKQLAVVLFEKLALPIVKKTKTGPSTDADVLEQLARLHELPAKIIEYRQYAKLKGTYVDALPLLICSKTGRVHTSFNQVVAATGRLSSNDPNLQNIPIRTEEGRAIRSAFLPGEPGWKLMTADYSQIELRVLAHYSGDEALCAAFAEDQDIHTRVASEVYAVAAEDVTSAMRRSAKAINFGIIYGQSAFGLAKALDIEQREAAAFIDAYFARYPGVETWMNGVLSAAARDGYVTTILGRKREIQGVRDPDANLRVPEGEVDLFTSSAPRNPSSKQRSLPERTAINTVIQGSAADLIKQAMIRVHRRMKSEKLQARMLLQIHDELVFETPPEEIERLSALVKEEMSSVGPLSVPLKIDIKLGDNWAECEAM